jgi:hypothetical protein
MIRQASGGYFAMDDAELMLSARGPCGAAMRTGQTLRRAMQSQSQPTAE